MPSIFSIHGGDGEIGAGNVPIWPDPRHSSNLEKQFLAQSSQSRSDYGGKHTLTSLLDRE